MKKQQLEQIKEVLQDLKAVDVMHFQAQDEFSEAEELIIATARSTTHLKATANNVKIEAKRIGLRVIGYEGLDTGWAIVDMDFIVVHIMLQDSRDFYNLDKLFQDSGD